MDRGVLARCAAVLDGYLGDPGVVGVVARAVVAVGAAHPGAPYCCDPVTGDDEPGVFVSAGVAEAISAGLAPLADVIVPTVSSWRTSGLRSRWRTCWPPRQAARRGPACRRHRSFAARSAG